MATFAKNLRKIVNKYSSTSIYEGFYDKEQWSGCGNYAMNKLLSGSFFKGFPFNKTTVIGGESGSGKSLIAATGAMHAQKELNAVIVWIDIEKASKETWLANVGLDMSEDRFVYIEAATISDVKKVVSDIVKDLKGTPEEKRENVFIVIDSYSMTLTDKEMEEALKGDNVGDQGQHAKQLKSTIKAITHLISRVPVAVVGMVHTMASGDKYNPDEIMSGGRGLQYACSLAMCFTKAKMKADQMEDGVLQDEYDDNKKVTGIRCLSKIYKSRFAKPNEKIEIQIPWGHGVDEFSGLFELFKESGIMESPSPGWYTYMFVNGTAGEIKFRKKDFREHALAIMKDIESLGDAAPEIKFEKEYVPHELEIVDEDEDALLAAEMVDESEGFVDDHAPKTKKK